MWASLTSDQHTSDSVKERIAWNSTFLFRTVVSKLHRLLQFPIFFHDVMLVVQEDLQEIVTITMYFWRQPPDFVNEKKKKTLLVAWWRLMEPFERFPQSQAQI